MNSTAVSPDRVVCTLYNSTQVDSGIVLPRTTRVNNPAEGLEKRRCDPNPLSPT